MSVILNNHNKSIFTTMNVNLHVKNVDTDTIRYYTPAVDDGSIFEQLFVGTNSIVSYVYHMKTDKKFVNRLEENICE